MSAAIWAEPETDAAHESLGRVTVHPEQLAGRAPRPKARLVVWGTTEEDCRRAEQDARVDPSVVRYRITQVEESDTPISSNGGPAMIAFGSAYDRAWIAYRLDEPDAN